MAEHVLLDLADYGQDFLYFRVAVETGEIVACGPFQADIWCGRHVRPDTESWQAGSRVVFHDSGKQLNYPVKHVSRHDGDVDVGILRQLSQHDAPMPVTGQADMREMKRLYHQNLVYWFEAPRSPGSTLRGHAGITAAGLDFLNRMTERA